MPVLPATLPIPLYGTDGTIADVPERYPVALAGRGLHVDWANYQRQTLPMLRGAWDFSRQAGGQSRNTEGFWVQYGNDWRKGAGQSYYDRTDSDQERFNSSLGFDIWTRGRLSLLPDTTQVAASANSNLVLLVAGSNVYKVDGTSVTFSTTGAVGTFTNTVTLTGVGASITGCTTDGTNVYFCDGAHIWRVAIGVTGAQAAWSSIAATGVWYANGRIIIAVANVLEELAADGTTVTVAKTHPSSAFRWTSVCAANTGIYAAGTAGNLSELYFITVTTSTGALAAPYSAAAWPAGEAINVVAFYAGVLFLGTSLGFRIATLDNSGYANYGDVTLIPGGVRAVAFEGRYGWFSWTNFDSTHTGLGRVDLGMAVDATALAYAYASDLMVVGSQGTVTTVARFNSATFFGAATAGFYTASTNKVPSAYLRTGYIDHADVENKVTTGVAVRHEPLHGTVDMTLAFPDGTTYDCGISSTALSTSPDTFGGGRVLAQRYELVITATRSATDATTGPAILLWKLLSSPTGTRVDEIMLAVDARSSVGGDYFSPLELFQWLKGLQRAGLPVLYQEGSAVYTVLVDQVNVKPSQPRTVDNVTGLDGIYVCRLLTLEL